jgi:hypothetical protein
MRPLKIGGCGALVALLSLFPARAQAGASARLVYLLGPGADSCPREQAVREAVRARLGYDPFFPWAHDTLFVEITRGASSFRAEVKVVDEDNRARGTREIAVEGEDCTPLVDAMALTISLTIDPASILGSPPAAPSAPADSNPLPATGSTTEPPPVPPAALAPPAAPREALPKAAPAPETKGALTAHAGLSLLGSVGATPSATAGLALLAGVTWRALSIDAEAAAVLPASGASTLPGGVTVSAWLATGSLVPCAHLGALFGCVVVSGGRIAISSSLSNAPGENASWFAAGARVGAEWPIWRSLSARGYVEGIGPLTRHTFRADGNPIYNFSPVAGTLGLGVVWRFR